MRSALFETTRIYHANLPDRIRGYLNGRGVTEPIIERFLLGWDGRRISIPITNRDGEITFFKFARDPDDKSRGAKMLASPGSRAELYGWEHVGGGCRRLIVCEGEFDRLVLEGQGFPAVTSTGGASVFRKEWAEALRDVPEINACFDRDRAGVRGLLRVAKLIPRVRAIELPEAVDDGGDVTDFFVRLGRTADDFERLLAEARPVPPAADLPRLRSNGSAGRTEVALRDSVDALKEVVPIEIVVGDWLVLRPSGEIFVGRCPFHDDERPSFAVYPKSGRFYCFGCAKGGDAITFLQEVDRLSFNQALDVLEALRRNHGRNAA